ncbi:MAG: FtsX-like permease family protein [Lachnospiraceae bacterium]|nr:FtsX-like permease family protein [Lachnospiraceae bacterium]
MKKRALRKDFHIEIKKSLNRFLSIFFIVALGVAFFSGIQSAAPDMRSTGDWYFDDSNLMDIRVISTLGLTQDDLEALSAVEGVELVNGCYMEDVYCGTGDAREVLHVESLPADMNKLAAEEGELPKQAGECFLDSAYAVKMGYAPGDEIEIAVSDEENSQLKRRKFTVSGYGHSPCYISFGKGNTTLGTGAVAGIMYVTPQDFDSEVYSVAYLTAAGAIDETAFTDGYEDLVDAVRARVEDIEDARCEIRYDEVMDEAQEKLADAKQEVEDGKKELADAKQELADGRAEADEELAEAESELLDGQEQIRDGKRELNDAQKEVAVGEQELIDGEQELADNEQKLADGRAQYAEGQNTLAAGEQEYQSGLAQYNSEAAEAQEKLAAAQQELENGRASLTQGWEEYHTNLANIEVGEQQLAEAEQTLAQNQAAYDSGAAQLADGRAQYEAGMQQLAAGWEQYSAGQAQYEAGLAQYNTGQAQYEAGLQAYQQAYDSTVPPLQAAYDAACAAVNECNNSLQANRDAYAAKGQELSGAQGVLEAFQAELEALRTAEQVDESAIAEAEAKTAQQQETVNGLQAAVNDLQSIYDNELLPAQSQAASGQAQAEEYLNTAFVEFAQQQAQLDASASELAAAKQNLDENAAMLAATEQALNENAAILESTRQMLEQQEAEFAAAGEQLSAGWQELNAKKEELVSGRTALEQAKATLEASEQQLADGQKEIDSGYNELKKAKAKLTAARQELDMGWAKLSASQSELAEGERQLEDGRNRLSGARGDLEDARQQIADAKKELAENKQKIKDGWDEYEEGRLEAEEKIADGEQKIKDAEQELLDAEQEIANAEQELADLKFPEWYVNDRNALPEYTGFGENAERIGNLAKVIPVLFFLVAALISLTTMTRMVEEQRTQIGTLKALGYSKAAIASKYLKYAFWATMGGSLLGILVGEKLLPWVIINAYGIVYQYLPRILIPYNWTYILVAAGAALFCTIGATFMACWRELLAVPAQLMRPPAPKEGKRVFLEHLPFLWRRMSFSWKSTVRNLMRYKKRFLMTVVGIGGCMGLLMVGYGLQDSIMDVGVLQFEELQTYDAMVILDANASEEEKNEPKQMIQEDARVSEAKQFYMHQEEIRTDGITDKEWSVYVYVPEDMEKLEDFLCFRDRATKETYELTDEGAIITEKVADELGIHPGDTLLLKQEEGEDIEVPITAVCENYLHHYLYMTPALYEKVYGKAAEYNSIFFRSPEDQSVVEKIGEQLLSRDAVLNITYTRTMADQIDSMLGAMDIVMIVLIVSAGMLAFVVLYNLNNININERRRELATLKVLGFYDGEVGAYVYRENVILTLIGAGLGVLIGKLLHAYVITTVEVDTCMFGRNINLDSFVYGTVLTIGFSVIVNFVMYFKLRKIDMVESLKSIE